jgi:diaminohydroxyphosphoribosylaminopyrimidine deaminase/5-amino-6-(5-phosphoribosylamino)uracil reductase
MVRLFFRRLMIKINDFESKILDTLLNETADLRGTQYPNPAVGAAVVKDGQIISKGFHYKAGEPHAEAAALSLAGDNSKGATLIITLEPCIHKGKTPPCVELIIQFGITRCIWAVNDPNPTVLGKSKALLEAHGIEVLADVAPIKGQAIIKEFDSFFTRRRPYVYVKAALSLDGFLAPDSQKLHYISSAESLRLVQQLRTYVQAICVGAKTINVDQPRLSIRIDRCVDHQPFIVILDPKNYVDMNWVQKKLSEGRDIILFQSAPLGISHDRLTHLDGLTSDKVENWRYVFKTLYEKQVQGVLVEGGSAVFQSILSSGLFDELWLTKVPHLFQSDAAVPFLNQSLVSDISLRLDRVDTYGTDVVMRYKNNHVGDF